MTSQAMTLVSGNTYQINSTARRVFDPDGSFAFTDVGSTIAASNISSIDYLFGKVTFASPKTTVVLASGNYLPVADIIGAHSYTLNLNRAVLEDTDFTSTGWVARGSVGLLDAKVSLSRWEDLDVDYFDTINDGVNVVLDIASGGESLLARGFFKLESDNLSGDVTALEASELSFVLDGGTTGKNFSFSA
jgi:hypothetical protein